jgi:hypothetical protein
LATAKHFCLALTGSSTRQQDSIIGRKDGRDQGGKMKEASRKVERLACFQETLRGNGVRAQRSEN